MGLSNDARTLRRVLGVNAYQPLVYVATRLLLFAIAAVATVLPARRAMRIDPVAALRQD